LSTNTRYNSEQQHLLFPGYNGAFFAAKPQKTGLFAAIFWLRQKDFRCNPLRGPGASKNGLIAELAQVRKDFCFVKIAARHAAGKARARPQAGRRPEKEAASARKFILTIRSVIRIINIWKSSN
jgi:hypothetical protein